MAVVDAVVVAVVVVVDVVVLGNQGPQELFGGPKNNSKVCGSSTTYASANCLQA